MKKLISIFFIIFSFNIISAQGQLDNNKFLLANELESSGQLEKAKEIYEELYYNNKTNPPYLDALLRVYDRLKEFDKAHIILTDALQKNPRDFNIYGKLGSVYFKMGKREEAFSIWNAGLQHEAPNAINYKIIANYIIQNRAYDEAIDILIQGREKSNNANLFSMDIAHLYAVTMQFEKSAEEYCNLVLQDPKLLNTVNGRISGYLRSDQAESDFLKIISHYYESNKSPVTAELLINILKKTDRYDEAATVVSDLDEMTGANGSNIFNFARQAFTNKAYKASAESYRKIIDEQMSLSLLPQSHLGYVRALEADLNVTTQSNNEWKYIVHGDTSSFPGYRQLISSYLNVIKLFNRADISNEVNYRLGTIYLDKLNQPDKAKSYFNNSVKSVHNSKYSALAQEKTGNIYILENKLDSAKAIFTELTKTKKLVATEINKTKFILGKIHFWQNDFKDALNLFSELTGNSTDNIANDALEMSLIINSANKDSVNLSKIAKADLLFFRSKYSDAAKIYEEIYNLQGLFFLNEYAGLKYAESNCYTLDFDKSINVLAKMAESEKLGIFYDKALFLLGEVYQFGTKDLDNAKSTYRTILEKFTTSLYLDKARENLKAINNKAE